MMLHMTLGIYRRLVTAVTAILDFSDSFKVTEWHCWIINLDTHILC